MRDKTAPGSMPVPAHFMNAQSAMVGLRLERDILYSPPGSPGDIPSAASTELERRVFDFAQVERVFRTEINRAHGEAYMAAGEGTPGFAGWRFLLS